MKKDLRVLIIEDYEDDALLMLRELGKGGFDVEHRRVDTPEDLKDTLASASWDLVIADYNVPGLNALQALDVCSEYDLDIPFIVVSGAIGEETAVAAMKAGAHDYIMKDNLSRLVPAVERELRDAETRRANRRAADEIRHLNRLLQTILEINQMVVRESSKERLLDETCRILVDHGGFRMAWVGMADLGNGAVSPAAHAGFSVDYIENLEVRCDDTPRGRGPTGTCIRTGKRVIVKDMDKNTDFAPWRESALKHGYRSCAAFPLVVRDRVVGSVNVYSEDTVTFGAKMVDLLEDLASEIGYALEALEESADKTRAERALKESEERFRQLFEQNVDPLILVNPDDGKVLDANPAAVQLYGYSKAELHQEGCLFFDTGDCERFEKILKNAEEGEGFSIYRMNTRRKDGGRIIVYLRAKKIRLEQTDVIYCTMRDMTQMIRMEEEAKVIQAKLIHANKMASLGTLASGVAHEINNPNNFIMFNTSLLEEAWQDAVNILKEYYDENGDFLLGGLSFTEMQKVVPELLAGITDGSHRIKSIVENLKDFSRMDTSGKEGTFDVNKAVKASASILNNQIGKYTEDFTVNCRDGLPHVRGSLQKIEQVIINLIINSLHALPDKKSSVRVETDYDVEDDTVVVRVTDQGRGIPKDVMDRITEPFFTTKSDTGGTGLGLSISYSIIKEHRGALDFTSEPGKGTTATIRLPAAGTAAVAS